MRGKTVLMTVALGMIIMLHMPVMSQPPKPVTLSAVDKRLQKSVKSTYCLHLYGDGRLWRDATKISGIQADQGIEVRDPKLIRALLQNFRCTDQTINQDLDSESYGYFMLILWEHDARF